MLCNCNTHSRNSVTAVCNSELHKYMVQTENWTVKYQEFLKRNKNNQDGTRLTP